jgi:hypothetical protein
MIKVDFESWRKKPECETWWTDWVQTASTATQKLIDKYEADGFVTEKDLDSKIWGELKEMLLEHCLDGKCAYCEISIKQSRQSGHQEHFRPKLKVNYRKPDRKKLSNARIKDPQGATIDHPGYFWLAYNHRNLLPSCEKCNTGMGKKNQFPLADDQRYVMLVHLTPAELATLKNRGAVIPSKKWPDFYYLGPEDLDAREPRTLLHPYFDNPREHLVFGYAGVEAAREDPNTKQPSRMGLDSIEVLNLKDPNLRDARHREQINAATRYLAAYNNALLSGSKPDDCKSAGWTAVDTVRAGKTPFSAAANDQLVERFGPSV